MRTTIVLALVLLLGSSASAHDSASYQWVGPSRTDLTGRVGFLTLAAQCRTDFGPGARMCTGAEIRDSSTLVVDEIPVEGCWVRPEPIAISSSQGAATVLEKTGVSFSLGGGFNPSIDCIQWGAEFAGALGFRLRADGRFDLGSCDEARPVACCRPMPVSTPPVCRGGHCRSGRESDRGSR